MRILIVRHAEPNYDHDSLTEKGHREAELLARRLAAIPTKAYYVSPLGRAQETAGYTLRLVHRTAETLPWLAEFRGAAVDPVTGKPHIPWDFPTPAWYDHSRLMDRSAWPDDPLTSGGNVREIWEETQAGIDALLLTHGYRRAGCMYRCDRNTDDTLVLFCHFGIGMAILSYLTGLPPVPIWQSFLCLPSSITTLITQERVKGEVAFRCLCAGDVSHLLQAGEPISLAGLYPECYNGVDNTAPSTWPAQPTMPIF